MSVVRDVESGPPAPSPAYGVRYRSIAGRFAAPLPARAPAVRACALGLSLLLLASPARAQSPDASQAQDLTNCAGAVAALGGYDVLTFAGNENNEWGAVLARIMAAMNREPGVEGMTGRYAASAARGFWAERPRAEQETQARSCRERFGSN